MLVYKDLMNMMDIKWIGLLSKKKQSNKRIITVKSHEEVNELREYLNEKTETLGDDRLFSIMISKILEIIWYVLVLKSYT